MRNFQVSVFRVTFVFVGLFYHFVFANTLPTDIDCRTCSSEECTLNINIPCCKVCLAHIKCTPKEMVVMVPRTAMNESIQSLSLADSSCKGVVKGKYIVFKTGTSECGTKSILLRRTHIMYRNEIRHENGKPLYSLTCLFKRNSRTVRKGVKVNTEMNKKTRMYHTTVFGRRKYHNSIYLDDNDYFFFEIKGPSYLRQRNMQMAVKSCRLDITENSNVPGNYQRSDILISNG